MPALTTTHVVAQKRDGRAFDEVSDAVDEGRCTFSAARHLDHGLRRLTLSAFTVNVQKLKLWDDESEFDTQKDKAHFRQYEDACDRVKNFYKEQHGTDAWPDYLDTTVSLCLIPPLQRTKLLRSTSRLASTSRAVAVPAWASGRPWKCSTPSSTSLTPM